MKTRKLVSSLLTLMLSLSLSAVLIVLVGCSSNSEGGGPAAPTQTPEEALESAELSWSGYTMGVDCVTADPERMASSDLSGQGIRITFRYISGGSTGGFDGNQVLNNLDSEPIVLRDSSGNEHTYNGGVTDIMLVFSGNSLNIAEDMPRFGIIFDVPAGTELGDYTLVVGDSTLTLVEFITPEYAEYIAE